MKRHSDERGFTLIEIAVSVALIMIGLTTILVMQTNFLTSFFVERSMVRAALLSKRIFTEIELSGEVPELGTESGRIDELLDDFDLEREERTRYEREYEGWVYEQDVSNEELLANVQAAGLEDVLRKIDLRLRWDEESGEEFRAVYYVRTFNRIQIP